MNRNRRTFNVPSDGNCMVNALSYQLLIFGRADNHFQLRQAVVQQVASNCEVYHALWEIDISRAYKAHKGCWSLGNTYRYASYE